MIEFLHGNSPFDLQHTNMINPKFNLDAREAER
jgi:hypothetical protein